MKVIKKFLFSFVVLLFLFSLLASAANYGTRTYGLGYYGLGQAAPQQAGSPGAAGAAASQVNASNQSGGITEDVTGTSSGEVTSDITSGDEAQPGADGSEATAAETSEAEQPAAQGGQPALNLGNLNPALIIGIIIVVIIAVLAFTTMRK